MACMCVTRTAAAAAADVMMITFRSFHISILAELAGVFHDGQANYIVHEFL